MKPKGIHVVPFFISFCIRKWRYQVSDFFGSYWHSLGSYGYINSNTVVQSKHEGKSMDSNSIFNTIQNTSTEIPLTKKIIQNIYKLGNKLTTRNAQSEFFMAQIPSKTTHIEFIYPSSIPLSQVKTQLLHFMQDVPKFTRNLLFLSLMLPLNFYISKFYIVLANVCFTYHVFRCNQAFRSVMGSKRFQTLLDTNRVTFTSSNSLETLIEQTCDRVVKENELQWKYSPGDDLHDLVVEQLSKELRLPELKTTIRRTRLVSFISQ
jgi:hypothetical protein